MAAIVLTYKEAGEESPAISVCAYGFKWANLSGATIIDGDPYYIAEAVDRGAINPEQPVQKVVKRGRAKSE